MNAACGTMAGYFVHRRRGETACDACKAGFAAYSREQRRKGPTTCADCGVVRTDGTQKARYCRECSSTRANEAQVLKLLAVKARRGALVHVGVVPFTWLPSQHEVMRRIARPMRWRDCPGDPWAVFVSGPCAWCGGNFTAASAAGTDRWCSKRCGKRAGRAARRARENGATGTYTWAEVMRLFLAFDRRCAYCHDAVDGQPDPDHVVPLSRGGSNSITNILPSCRACNCDKQALSLEEWAVARKRQGKPPVTTSWPVDDPRYRHITSVMPQLLTA